MISQRAIREHSRLVSRISRAAQRDAQRAIALGDRDMLLRIVNNYRRTCSFVSAKYYSSLRSQQIGGRHSARTIAPLTYSDFFDLVDRSNVSLTRTVGLAVQLACRDTLVFNGLRDSPRPRYARVPQGSNPCEFCILLASRGFAYHSKASAGGNGVHADCKCAIVPGWGDSPRVEGFDPEDIFAKRDEVFRSIPGRMKGESQEAFTRRLTAEMRRRDDSWLRTGKVPTIDLNGQSPLAKEIATANRLADNGINVRFLPRSDDFKSPDISIRGKAWEMKQPTGGGGRNISNQFNEARGQSPRLVIDATNSPLSTRDIESEISRQLALRDDFSEVILLRGSNHFRRFTK